MTEELQKKAEDFIIDRYKIAECYREDNAETREYMRMDVHSQYEEEYKLYLDATKELEKENAELRKIAEFQQSSNMNRHFENKKLKEGLEVGSILNKGLNSLNKALEEERDKYRNMVFNKNDQLTKAKELLLELYDCIPSSMAESCRETLQKVALFFKNSEVEK